MGQQNMPQEIRDANTTIQAGLAKLQQNLKQLEINKGELGGDKDNYDTR